MTFPYAMQHSLCFATLTFLEIMLNPKSWTPDSLPTVEKMTRWMHEAMEGLKSKDLSAGARRAIHKMYDTCENFYKSNGGGEIPSAIFLCAVAHLIFDCKITCPAFACGRAWYNLDRMITTELKASLSRFPESGEIGVKLYEDILTAGGF